MVSASLFGHFCVRAAQRCTCACAHIRSHIDEGLRRPFSAWCIDNWSAGSIRRCGVVSHCSGCPGARGTPVGIKVVLIKCGPRCTALHITGAIGEPPPGCPPRAFENLLLALITHCPCDLPIFTCRHSHFIPQPTPHPHHQPPTTPTHIYYFIFSLASLSLAGLINLMEISSSQGWPPMFVI